MNPDTAKPKAKRGRKLKIRRTISLNADLLRKGRARAAAERRSFSNYLETLMVRDTALEKEAVVNA